MIRGGLIATLTLIVAVLAVTVPAAAHVVEVTTSLPLAEANDEETLRTALRTAVEKARTEAIAFEPAMVAVTGVRVLGERLLVGLLFADEDGKAMLDALRDSGGDERPGRDGGGSDGVPSDTLRI